MLEHGMGEGLDVVGQRVVAAVEGRPRPRGPVEEEAGPRTGPQLDPLVGTRRLAERHDVGAQGLAAVDRAGGGLRGEDRGHIGHRLDLQHPVGAGMLGEHRRLLAGVRVAHLQPDHEAVELGLGQRVGALVGDRVLGGDHQEGPGQLVSLPVDGDPALLHALEQPRLRLRGGAVYLVDEDDVREDRTGVELETGVSLVEDVGPDDVGREQVHRALHPGVGGVDRAGERAGERRLADPGVVLDQDVALGHQRDDQLLENFVAHLDRAPDAVAQPLPDLGYGDGIELGHRGHPTMVGEGRTRPSGLPC